MNSIEEPVNDVKKSSTCNSVANDFMLQQLVNFEKINNILITNFRHHGDILLSTPIISVLKKQYPHVKITFLVYSDTLELIKDNPFIDNVFSINKPAENQEGTLFRIKQELNLLNQLRKQHFDLLIHLSESWRGVLIKWLAHIPIAVAESFRKRNNKIWHYSFKYKYDNLSPDRSAHRVNYYLNSLRALGIKPNDNEKNLQLFVSHDNKESANQKLNALGLNDHHFIILHPSSRYDEKQWTTQNYAHLISKLPGTVLLTSSASSKEMTLVKRIIEQSSKRDVVSLAGKLTLSELAHCISLARLFIGVDSAPIHIAAAMQTPSIAIFGPTDDHVWAPWNVRHEIVKLGLTCQPCNQHGCQNSYISDCLIDLRVPTVYQACLRMLDIPIPIKNVSLNRKD